MKKVEKVLLLVVILSLVFNLFVTQAAPAGFVTTDGKNFLLEGKTVRFCGTNIY